MPPETPQPAEPAPGWTPRRNPRGSVADAIGSCLRGARDGDKHVRRRIQGWLAFLTGGGFAVYAASLLLNLIADEVRRGWVADDRQQAALVRAIEANTERLAKLIDVLEAERTRRDRDHAEVIYRLGRPPREGGR